MDCRRLWNVRVTCEGRLTVEKQTFIDMADYTEAGKFISLLASMSGGKKSEIVKIEAYVVRTEIAKPQQEN